MAPSTEQPDDQLSLLQKAAEEHVSQILDRRRAAQESRAAALARLPEPLTLKIRSVRDANLKTPPPRLHHSLGHHPDRRLPPSHRGFLVQLSNS